MSYDYLGSEKTFLESLSRELYLWRNSELDTFIPRDHDAASWANGLFTDLDRNFRLNSKIHPSQTQNPKIDSGYYDAQPVTDAGRKVIDLVKLGKITKKALEDDAL